MKPSQRESQIKTAIGFLFSAKFAVLFIVIAIGIASLRFTYDKDLFTWADFTVYEQANKDFVKPAPWGTVVFAGDSISEFWDLSKYFPNKPFVNRGIKAQTSQQVFLRFRRDVIQLQPTVVIIQAGINDNHQKFPLDVVLGNLISMAEVARINGIVPIISSLLPIGKTELQTKSAIQAAKQNALIQEYCKSSGTIYIDYYSAMVDNSNGLVKEGLTYDDLHPSEAGYKLMVPLTQQAIDEALKKNPKK